MCAAIVGFYGKSGSGKTSLLVHLIKKLTQEGYHVATIKQTDKHIGVDTSGKDTCKHKEAGASITVFLSPVETDVLIKEKKTVQQIVDIIQRIGTYDIVLVEGANEPFIPKIRVGDCEEREQTIGIYNDNMETILDLIKEKIHESNDYLKKNSVQVKINGKTVQLSEFPSLFIKNTIIGMLGTLKGVDDVHTAEITF
ncbi:MAG: molybdopterin-guanine dinucleotide biosynthesis protein B [Euryarchaeota archaeon]|nr:molybdopterin-guanine dinucleotide biosynthesis protein B [Euryarchaeota archaeon]